MKITEILSEGQFDNKVLNQWYSDLNDLLADFNDLANMHGVGYAKQKLKEAMIVPGKIELFVLLGDGDLITLQKWKRYQQLCARVIEKMSVV